MNAPYAYPIILEGLVNFQPSGFNFNLGKNDDLGAVVPTVIYLTDDNRRSSLEAFIRVEGRKFQVDEKNVSFGDNLCVSEGFACGRNLRIPADLESCFIAVAGVSKDWAFFDSQACPAAGRVPERLLIARYVNLCTREAGGGCKADSENAGFYTLSRSVGVNVGVQQFAATIAGNNPGTAGWVQGSGDQQTSREPLSRSRAIALHSKSIGNRGSRQGTMSQPRHWHTGSGPRGHWKEEMAFTSSRTRRPVPDFSFDISNWNVPRYF